MTDEITKQNDKIKRTANSNMTLLERYKSRQLSKNIAIILDLSSSMNCHVEPGQSRLDVMKQILKSLRLSNSKIYGFNDDAFVVQDITTLKANGLTYMSKAFELVKNHGFKDALLLTDGFPSDADDALQSVKGLNLKIMYIGSGDKPEFLDRLAAVCGSFCTVEDLTRPKELTTKIQLLLGNSNFEKESIKL